MLFTPKKNPLETQKISFRLTGIKTRQFALLEDVRLDDNEINLQVGIDFGIDKEKKVVVCLARFRFLSQEIPFIIIQMACDFQVENRCWEGFENNEKNEIIIPEGFLRHLAVITVGTTRGALHVKTENTPFNKFFLPTVDLTEIVKGNGIFKEEKPKEKEVKKTNK